MKLELTGHLRFVRRGSFRILQQQWGYRNNWAWSQLVWKDVPEGVEEPEPS